MLNFGLGAVPLNAMIYLVILIFEPLMHDNAIIKTRNSIFHLVSFIRKKLKSMLDFQI